MVVATGASTDTVPGGVRETGGLISDENACRKGPWRLHLDLWRSMKIK